MSTDDMKGDMFQHELSKTSSVFGRKKDIRVVFQGEDAMTNGALLCCRVWFRMRMLGWNLN